VLVGGNLGDLDITSAIAGIVDKFDEAEAGGIKIEVSFAEHLWDGIDDDNIQGVIDAVAALKGSSVIQGYRLGDELPVSNHIPAKAMATLIRAEDPNRQIDQVQHPVRTEAEVNQLMGRDTPTTDDDTNVVDWDSYEWSGAPSPTNPANIHPGVPVNILQYTRRRADECQTNGWDGNVRTIQATGAPSTTIRGRFPTPEEYRWEVFTALASTGARGIKNFTTELTVAGWEDFAIDAVRPVFAEMQMIQEGMETGYNVGTVSTNYDDRAFGGAARFNETSNLLLYDSVEERYWLIVTNNEDATRTIDVDLSGLPVAPYDSGSGIVVERPREATTQLLADLGGGTYRLSESLDPFEIGVYSIPTSASSEPTYLRNMSFNMERVTAGGIPAGYNAYDIKATTETGLSSLELVLEMDDPGDIYQNNGGTADDPNEDYATFVTVGPGANEADTNILGAPFGIDPVSVETFDDQTLKIAWGPEYGVDTGAGELLIARIVVKDTANGTWTVRGRQSGKTTIVEEWFDSVQTSGSIVADPGQRLGDVNGDDFVGGSDLNTILSNWGMSGATRLQGDLTGEGDVGGADYNQVLSHWGEGTPPEPGAIPEPATLGLLLIGALVSLRRRR